MSSVSRTMHGGDVQSGIYMTCQMTPRVRGALQTGPRHDELSLLRRVKCLGARDARVGRPGGEGDGNEPRSRSPAPGPRPRRRGRVSGAGKARKISVTRISTVVGPYLPRIPATVPDHQTHRHDDDRPPRRRCSRVMRRAPDACRLAKVPAQLVGPKPMLGTRCSAGASVKTVCLRARIAGGDHKGRAVPRRQPEPKMIASPLMAMGLRRNDSQARKARPAPGLPWGPRRNRPASSDAGLARLDEDTGSLTCHRALGSTSLVEQVREAC